jgi:hypothetical protein
MEESFIPETKLQNKLSGYFTTELLTRVCTAKSGLCDVKEIYDNIKLRYYKYVIGSNLLDQEYIYVIG